MHVCRISEWIIYHLLQPTKEKDHQQKLERIIKAWGWNSLDGCSRTRFIAWTRARDEVKGLNEAEACHINQWQASRHQQAAVESLASPSIIMVLEINLLHLNLGMDCQIGFKHAAFAFTC